MTTSHVFNQLIKLFTAIDYVVRNAFTSERGRRLDTELHVVVLTDGGSADEVDVASAALRDVHL